MEFIEKLKNTKNLKNILIPFITFAALYEGGAVYKVFMSMVDAAQSINLPINSYIFLGSFFTVTFMIVIYIIAHITSLILIIKNNSVGYLISGVASLLMFFKLLQIWVNGNIMFRIDIIGFSMFWIVLICLSFWMRIKLVEGKV